MKTCWKHNRELSLSGYCLECNNKPPERNIYKIRVPIDILIKAETGKDVLLLLKKYLSETGMYFRKSEIEIISVYSPKIIDSWKEEKENTK